jgi:hypothetical protein
MIYLFQVYVASLGYYMRLMGHRLLCGMCLEFKDASMVSNFSEKGRPSTAVVCHVLEENSNKKNIGNIKNGGSVRYRRKRWQLFHGRSTVSQYRLFPCSKSATTKCNSDAQSLSQSRFLLN